MLRLHKGERPVVAEVAFAVSLEGILRMASPTIYRAYVIDAGGNAVSTHEIASHSDYEAKERAAALVDRHTVELWIGPKCVARLTP